MPKNKPKETIEYVIRLQDKERQLLEDATTAYTVANVAEPVVNVIKDVTAMATIFAALYLLFPEWFNVAGTDDPPPQAEMEKDEGGLTDYLELQNLVAIGTGTALIWATGGVGIVGSAILGTIGGTIVQEGAEEVIDDAKKAYSAAKKQARFLKLALRYAPELLGGSQG